MSGMTLSSLMALVTEIPDEELQQPVEVLALLKSSHQNVLLDAQTGSDRTAYLKLTTASSEPVKFFAEESQDDEHLLDHSYLTYGMLKMLGSRLGWEKRQDSVTI